VTRLLAPLVVDPRQTLEEGTYRHLHAAITSGAYAPGTKLVGSRLAAELGVSRTTVANALKRLASEGFVVGAPHKEATVAALDEAGLREIFLIRHALEETVMREVARRIDGATLARLGALDDRLRASVERHDAAAYRRLEREYHLLIYAASGLPLAAALLTELWDRLEPYRGRRYRALALLAAAHADHVEILAALAAGDGERAAAAMRAHVDRGHERFRAVLGVERGAAPGRPPVGGRAGTLAGTSPLGHGRGSLPVALRALPDRRRRQGRVHPQAPVLALIVCAALCGARSRYAAVRWGKRCHPAIRATLGLPRDRGPSGPTVHRLLHELDAAAFVRLLEGWLVAHGVAAGDPDPAPPLDRSLTGIHGERLPGIGAVAGVAARLRPVLLAAAAGGDCWAPSAAERRLAALPAALLGGEVGGEAPLAWLELRHHILSQDGATSPDWAASGGDWAVGGGEQGRGESGYHARHDARADRRAAPAGARSRESER